MTSKSFSSKGLLGDSMRRNLWALVLSGVGFFLSLLLPALMTAQRALENRAEWLANLTQAGVEQNWQQAMNTVAATLGGENPFVKAAFLVMAVVCGVALFAYLHNRQKVDFYHSLPISRTRLFANNFLTGIVCTLLTYFIMLAITLACVYAMGCGEAVRWGEIGGAVLCNLIIFLLVYALTVLTTIVCGNTVITLLLLVWVLFSPALVRMLYNGLMDRFYVTYTGAGGTDAWTTAFMLSPVLQYFDLEGIMHRGYDGITGMGQNGSALGLLLAYLAAAVIVTVLAAYLFRHRRSERAGTALAFLPIRLPLKVYMCLVMGVSFGIVFNLIAGGFWFWPGLVIGTVLFHWIIEIIYAFDFRAIFAKPLHLLAILVVLVAGMLAMQFDVTGFDTWLPDRDDLTAVDIYSGSGEPALTDPSNIDAVYRLMEIGVQTVQEEDTDGDGSLSYTQVTVRCQMGSRTAARQYMLPETEEVDALLDQIEQSEEYKRTKWALFSFDASGDEHQPMITVNVETADGISFVELRQTSQITQVIDTLREEALAGTQESKPVMSLELYYLGNDGSREEYYGLVGVTEANTRTLALIEQMTGLTPVTIRAEDVDRMWIEYLVPLGQDASEWQTVEVTDPADMQALLDNAFSDSLTGLDGYRYANRENYTVDLYVEMETGEQRHLCYLQPDWPYEILDKYRPDGVSDSTPERGMAATAEAAS